MYHVDIKELVWVDEDTRRLNKVVELENKGDLVLIWYKDLGTSELHCMSENMFTLKHSAEGILNQQEIV